jgi:hypothetical protein
MVASLMTAISHLLVTLPNRARTHNNPNGLERLQYVREKQIDTRATSVFMNMLHSGVGYRLQQVVADKSQINFDTVPGVTEYYREAYYALEEKIAAAEQRSTFAMQAEKRMSRHVDTVLKVGAWCFLKQYRKTKASLLGTKAVGEHKSRHQTCSELTSKRHSEKLIRAINQTALDKALAPEHAKIIDCHINTRGVPQAISNAVEEALAAGVDFDRRVVVDAFVAGAIQAVAVLSQQRMTKLDIELVVAMIGQLFDQGVFDQFEALKSLHFWDKPSRYIPCNSNSIILSHRSESRLGRQILEYGDGRPQCFERAYHLAALEREKANLMLSIQRLHSGYPGDLAFAKPYVGTVDIKQFRQQMIRALVAPGGSDDAGVADRPEIIRSCLAIIDRQLIPGGNPALAADFMRVLHLLNSIQQIKRGRLVVGLYTDPDSQTGFMLMSRLAGTAALKRIRPHRDVMADVARADLSVVRHSLARAQTACSKRLQGLGRYSCLRKKFKSFPFELYATHITTPARGVGGRCRDKPRFSWRVGRYYSNYDVGSMHVSGRATDRAKLNEAERILLRLLRISVLKYAACFRAVPLPQRNEHLFEHRKNAVTASLASARDLAENSYLGRLFDPLRNSLPERRETLSLGDLGRSIHHLLPLTLDEEDASRMISAG